MTKLCPPDKILNIKTNRCVLRTGNIGKKILKETQEPKTKKPKEPKTKKPKEPKTKKSKEPKETKISEEIKKQIIDDLMHLSGFLDTKIAEFIDNGKKKY